MKNFILFLVLFLCFSHFILAQNKMYKGNNVLMPENMIIGYGVPLKSCVHGKEANCKDTASNIFLRLHSPNYFFQTVLKGVLPENVKVYTPGNHDMYNLYNYRTIMDTTEIKQYMGYRVDSVYTFTDEGDFNK